MSLVGSHVLCVFVFWAGEGGAWTGGGAVVEGFGRADTKERDSHCLPACLSAGVF